MQCKKNVIYFKTKVHACSLPLQVGQAERPLTGFAGQSDKGRGHPHPSWAIYITATFTNTPVLILKASIGDLVWKDLDGDGVSAR